MSARRFLVGGCVQGVCFRAGARDQALKLGLRGSAVNLPDGRVEVIAVGDDAGLQALEDWLHRGPPAARVDQVRADACDETSVLGDGFRIG